MTVWFSQRILFIRKPETAVLYTVYYSAILVRLRVHLINCYIILEAVCKTYFSAKKNTFIYHSPWWWKFYLRNKALILYSLPLSLINNECYIFAFIVERITSPFNRICFLLLILLKCWSINFVYLDSCIGYFKNPEQIMKIHYIKKSNPL